MSALELTTEASPARRRRPTRIAAIAAAVAALALLALGAAALAGNTLRDGDGFFTWPRETFTTDTYAIAMKSVDITDAPAWAFGDLGLGAVRVEAEGDRPLFVGIAHADDVARYLAGVGHDDVGGLTYHPFDVDYDRTDGRAPSGAPADRPFWVASAAGRGPISLEWEPKPGDWRAVLMNADGTRGVTARLELGASTSMLWWAGAALLGAGVLLAGVAAVLSARIGPRR